MPTQLHPMQDHLMVLRVLPRVLPSYLTNQAMDHTESRASHNHSTRAAPAGQHASSNATPQRHHSTPVLKCIMSSTHRWLWAAIPSGGIPIRRTSHTTQCHAGSMDGTVTMSPRCLGVQKQPRFTLNHVEQTRPRPQGFNMGTSTVSTSCNSWLLLSSEHAEPGTPA